MASDLHVESNELLRFSDMIEEPRRRLAPLRGYEHLELVSLEKATDPLVSYVPEIKYMVQNALEDSCIMNDSLSTDERASIILFSMEWSPKEKSFRRFLNRTLRSAHRADWLPPWFLFLKLFLTALTKVPSISNKFVYRGAKINVGKDYPEGSKVIWWGFSSCTSSMDVLEDERFIGKSGIRTLFKIECDSGRDIRKYTLLPEDKEILLLPGCEFQVVSSMNVGDDAQMIHLKELKPKFPHIASVVVENPSLIEKLLSVNSQCTEDMPKLTVAEPKSPLEAPSNWQGRRDVTDVKTASKETGSENRRVNFNTVSNKILQDGALALIKAVDNNNESNLSPQCSHVKEVKLEKKPETDRSNTSRNGKRSTDSNSTANGSSSTVSSNLQPRDSNIDKQTSELFDKNLSNASFNEENIRQNVSTLVHKYSESYSEKDGQPTKAAIKDLFLFTTSDVEQQSIVVRELFSHVLKSNPLSRKAIGYLLNIVVYKKLIARSAFLSGIKMVLESISNFLVENPPILQRAGEFLGAFFGGPASNLLLLKPILQMIPNGKCKELFQYTIQHALEFSSKSHMQKLWQSSNMSLQDLIKLDSSNAAFLNEYAWLSATIQTMKDNPEPHADKRLVELFRAITEQGPKVADIEIVQYIKTNMNPADKYFIRNIVLSYLEACLVEREGQRKIQKCIAKARMAVLNHLVNHRLNAEIHAVYAIQNFVHKMGHPLKITQYLFDMFYDEECVSEEAFLQWFNNPDQSEMEGHEAVKRSTKDFFTWLQQADTEVDESQKQDV